MTLPTQMAAGIAFFEAAPPTAAAPEYLFLHGLGNSLDFWTAVAPRLAEHHRVIAIDIPGFGRSRLPLRDIYLDGLAERVASFCTAKNVANCVLVAHSMGTFVALRLAAAAPELFRQIVLVDGTLGRAVQVIQHPLRGLREPRLMFAVAAQFIGGLLPIRARVARVIGHSRLIRRLVLWPYVAAPARLDEETVSSALSHNGGWAVARALHEARRVDYPSLLTGHPVPVDLVWGAQDSLLGEVDVTQARTLMDVGDELRITGCGHWPMIEDPGVLVEFLLSRERP